MTRFRPSLGTGLASLLVRTALSAMVLLFAGGAARAEYRVAAGDTVEVAVAGLPEWRQRAQVQLNGAIALPTLGSVKVAGLTVAEMQAEVEALMATRTLRQRTSDGREHFIVIQPGDVAVTVSEYRPIYVDGDVLTPGQHPYRPAMTVRQSVALSGGYSIMRSRAMASSTDPADLHRDYITYGLEYAKAQVHLLRLKAELDGKTDFDRRVLANMPVPASTLDDLVQAELELLRASQDNNRQERDFLLRTIKQTEEQIAVLTEQEKEEERSVKADTEELERVMSLFGKGSLPSTRVSESRRAVLLSSTRRLQTTVNLMEMRRQRDEFRWRIDNIGSQHKLTLLNEVKESSVALVDLGTRLQAAAEKLRISGQGRPQFVPGETGRPMATIIRKNGSKYDRIAAEDDTELQPGDVVEVAFRSDNLAELPAR